MWSEVTATQLIMLPVCGTARIVRWVLPVSERSLITPWLGSGARRVKQHDLFVLASPPRVYRIMLDLPLGQLPLTCLLLMLRGFTFQRDMTVKDLFTTPPFRLLEEHELEIVFEVSRRAVANFRVESEGVGARLSTTTWVETWGWAARIVFGAYWLVVAPFSGLIRQEMLRAAKRQAERDARE